RGGHPAAGDARRADSGAGDARDQARDPAQPQARERATVSARRGGEPSPEIVAAIVAALSAARLGDGKRQESSVWRRRARPGVPAWHPYAKAKWLRRARLRAVDRHRGQDM